MGILKGRAKDPGFNSISPVLEVETPPAAPKRPKPIGRDHVGKPDGAKYGGQTSEEDVPTQHPDGVYLGNTETCGRYRNVASCAHMLSNLVRMSSGAVHTIDWQLGLRGADHHHGSKTAVGSWRRHFARPAQSFDALRENQQDLEYQENFRSSQSTPVDRRRDRNKAAIGIASIREVPDTFHREPGCEGAQAGQWLHIIKTKGVQRGQMAHHTQLRDSGADEEVGKQRPSTVPLGDNRSDICLVEMMGKKKWYASQSSNPRAAAPPDGDPRMHHLSILRVVAEPDDESRRLRLMQTSPRCNSRGSARSGARNTPSTGVSSPSPPAHQPLPQPGGSGNAARNTPSPGVVPPSPSAPRPAAAAPSPAK